jgi:streptogramin lyase
MALNNDLAYGTPLGAQDKSPIGYGASVGLPQEMAYGVSSPENIYADVLNEMAAIVRENSGNANTLPTISVIGTTSTSNAYWGGVLARNGKIYCAPYNATSIMEIDPIRRTMTTFGTVAAGAAKYLGGALGPNGKIYCAPLLATTILEIDPDRRIVSTFGNTTGFGYQAGAITLRNGTILCGPDDGGSNNTAALINTSNRTISRFISPPAGTQLPQSIGIQLHPLGLAICGPQTSNTMLVINVETRTYTTGSGPLTPTNGDWNGGALAANGNIYFVPNQNPTNILEFNPYRRTATFFGSIGSAGTPKYSGACLAPDGNIYAIGNSGTVLRINGYTRTVTTFGTISGAYRGLHMALNGKMYGIPLSVTTGTVELDFTHLKKFSDNLVLSTYINNY